MTLSPGDIVWAWHINDDEGPYECKIVLDWRNQKHLQIKRADDHYNVERDLRWFHIYPTKAEATDAYERQAKARHKAAMATVRRLRKEGG